MTVHRIGFSRLGEARVLFSTPRYQINRAIALIYTALMFGALVPPNLYAEFQAGAAKIDITPPLGVPLNGYFDRLGRGATAVHDPIWARCLYLNDGTTGVFWVTLDLCVVNRELRERVFELIPEELRGFPVILSATHNHSAQGAMIKHLIFRSVSGRFMPEVLDNTAKGIVDVIQRAYAERKRAVIGYTTFVQTDLSTNRRFPGGPTDTQVGVLRVEDPDGVPIAILANFAAHPTSVGGKDFLTISADYPGFFYAELEQRAGAGCVALFTNGAEGNQTCTNPTQAEGWDRTAAVGRILAERVYEAATKISCRELPLRVVSAEVNLPPVIAPSILPSRTVLQVLEIGDLCLTFFPGEPCVEIGLELRQRTLQRGYAAHFSIGVSNDYLLYFVPRSLYPKPIYESAMNFYGPGIEDWFYAEFGKLYSRGTPSTGETTILEPPITSWDGGMGVLFKGSPRDIGKQRALAFSEAIADAFQKRIVVPCADGSLIPKTGLWRWAPPFLDLTESALVRLAIGARQPLELLSANLFAEIEGLAESAKMPFDAVWLLQYLKELVPAGYRDELYQSPFCTMMAVIGERAGAEGIVVGRTLDDSNADTVVVSEYQPDNGKRFLLISNPWLLGGFSGMNEAGLVVCAESASDLGKPSHEGIPVHLVVRELLEKADSAEAAAALILEKNHLQGYRLLLASAPTASSSGKNRESQNVDARIIACGLVPEIQVPQDGMLLGGGKNPEATDGDTLARYERARALLNEERIVSPEEMQDILLDTQGSPSERGSICNNDTRYAVVFEPRKLRISISFRKAEGSMSAFETFSLRKGEP